MNSFRLGFKRKIEGIDDQEQSSNCAKQNVSDYDAPYNFDSLKPAIWEFTPDNRRWVVDSLASYVGKRINAQGRETDFSAEVKRPRATWPWLQQLVGAWVDNKLEEIHDVFCHENIKIGLAPHMRHWPASAVYGMKNLPVWNQGEDYPLYCLGSDLMAVLFERIPQFLLEPVDWNAAPKATPDHVSKIQLDRF